MKGTEIRKSRNEASALRASGSRHRRTRLLVFIVRFCPQNGDVCKDCTQIFELLSDLLSNTDLQVGSPQRRTHSWLVFAGWCYHGGQEGAGLISNAVVEAFSFTESRTEE